MKVVFRTDASLDIGTGHVMRCLTLARALREKGAICQFVCRAHAGNLIETIKEHGFFVTALQEHKHQDQLLNQSSEPRHSSWLGCDWTVDANQTIEVIGKQKPDWLIIDHYALDKKWEIVLKEHVKKILVIDDLADRFHDCDLLVDQNIGRLKSDYADLVTDRAVVLAGLQYALLRPEFVEAHADLETRTGNVRRVLVFFGGTDPENFTGDVLEALSTSDLELLSADVVMGINNPHIKSVSKQVKKRPRTRMYIQVNNMAELMVRADLFIGALGSVTWERCAVGLPGVCVALAENQIPVSDFLRKRKLVVCLKYGDTSPANWLRSVKTLMKNPKRIIQMGIEISSLVDLRGTERITDRMMKHN